MNDQNLLRPQTIDTYLLPKDILSESLQYLREFGERKYEGFMCWSGIIAGETNALIRSCIYPKAYRKSNYRYVCAGLDLRTVFDIGNQIFSRREFLLAQLHTHGFEAFHSSVDDNFPISHKTGFISIVIPYFARKKFYNNRTLVNCSVNEYLGNGIWRELRSKELKKRFKVVRSAKV